MFRKMLLATTGMMAPIGAANAAAFLVTVEAAGVQNTTSQFTTRGVETFNSRAATGTNATTGFASSFGGSAVSGTYAGVSIVDADMFGGADGIGRYAVAQNNGTAASYSISNLAISGGAAVNYFGFWLSALDAGNSLAFYKGATQVFSFSAADALATIKALPNASAYYGNPNANYSGWNSGEPYAFLNFYDRDDSFDRIVLTQTRSAAGYESDNHTIGNFTTTTGTSVAAVPEPASWAMMIVGFGLAGTALRRHKRAVAFA